MTEVLLVIEFETISAELIGVVESSWYRYSRRAPEGRVIALSSPQPDGVGSLKERVEHGRTGFIAKNYSEFAQYTLDLFEQDDLYNNLVKNLLELRGSKSWINSAKNFLSLI